MINLLTFCIFHIFLIINKALVAGMVLNYEQTDACLIRN